MAFGFFKKKKKESGPHYDPTNIRAIDIRKGFIFEYNGKTWEAEEEYEYDWGDSVFTYEFKIVAPDETAYLYIENDDEIECIVSKKFAFAKLGDKVEQKLLKKGKPPKEIEYDGTVFYRDEESPGFYRNIDNTNWKELISWTYYDDSERLVLVIEQWGENSFEASVGISHNEDAFSNILPV
jgi:hypothetical protein